MEKTIKERARQTYQNDEDYGLDYAADMLQKGYIKGATDQDSISRAEQKKIDIDKAWSWMFSHVCLHLGDKDSFIKAMEE